MVSERGDDKAKEVTPKTSDECGEETEVLPGCIDVMSPYFLHASDAPGHIHMGFVDGSIAMPTPDSRYLQQWMLCNAMVQEKEQLYDFLMGLDDEFAAVKSQILSSKRTPSLD
nr:Integrase, catalytic core [Ipomoea batatas]